MKIGHNRSYEIFCRIPPQITEMDNLNGTGAIDKYNFIVKSKETANSR